MLTSTKLGSLRALGSCRALAILAAVLVCGQQGLSFKLSEAPIPLAGSEENETIRQAVEEAVSERLERDMEDINNISNPTMENASDSMEGLGLAKNLEFLLVKVAQLEAVAEMQQAQANRQQKKIDLQQKEIDSLKAQIGNHKVPEGEALLQTEEEDAQTRLKEAQEIVKSVFLKHHRQREKGGLAGNLKGWRGDSFWDNAGILHRERETASAAESGTSRESSSDRDSATRPTGCLCFCCQLFECWLCCAPFPCVFRQLRLR